MSTDVANRNQQTNEHYRELFQALDQGFCTIEVLFDEEGSAIDYRFLDVNPAFIEQTGLRDAVGRRMRDLAPSHEEHWFRIYGEVARSGTAARFQHEAAALGRWYDVYAFRIGAPDLHRVAVLFQDIAGRRRAEVALQASEARYRALAHATANALYRYNADGTELLEVSGGSIAPHLAGTRPSLSWLHDYVEPDDR
jgi:PAS domain-containing protein